jgi:hypothetical protein
MVSDRVHGQVSIARCFPRGRSTAREGSTPYLEGDLVLLGLPEAFSVAWQGSG